MKRKIIHHENKLYSILLIVAVFLISGIAVRYYLQPSDNTQQKTPVSDVSIETIQPISTGINISLTDNQITSLLEMYKRDKDLTVGKSLLQYYISVADYDGGYELLLQMKKNNHLQEITMPTISYILFNHTILHGEHWNEIDTATWEVDSESNAFYNALSRLTKIDLSGFNADLHALESTSTVYKNLISALLKSKQSFVVLKDPPAHYEVWLIAATLMEAGYVPLSSLLAKHILASDKKYILSYEILSQAALKQKRYEEAVKHLQILFSLDSQNLSRTAFYLWNAYFWLKDYNNSLFYLNQVRAEQYLYDAVRYMILSYYHQKDYDKMMDWFRYLLTEQKITYNDYLLLYDIIFFEPYSKKTPETDALPREYALKVVIPYIDSCRKDIAANSPYVCRYGEAWRYLSQWKPDKALNDLLYLTKTYPHPTVFKALGDYYAFKGDNEKAQQYFMKSLLSTSDTYQNTSIFSWNSTIK